MQYVENQAGHYKCSSAGTEPAEVSVLDVTGFIVD